MSDRGSRPPEAGLAGMRIGLEFGSAEDFADGAGFVGVEVSGGEAVGVDVADVGRLEAGVAERHELFHGEVGHACASSPSQTRSLACARDSCDFEKLGVRSIISAISSWV